MFKNFWWKTTKKRFQFRINAINDCWIKNLAQIVDFLTKYRSNQDCCNIWTGTVVKSSKNSINLTFHRLPIFDWQCVVVHGWLLLDNILWYVEVFSYKHLPLHSWWLENREEITQLVLFLCVFDWGKTV